MPISLFAYMIEMRAVSGLIAAAMRSGSTHPCGSTGIVVTEWPALWSVLQAFRTESCSMALVMTCRLLPLAVTVPMMARWLASVAPDVKVISCAWSAPSECWTRCRAV